MFSIYNKDRFAYRRCHEWIFIPTTKKHCKIFESQFKLISGPKCRAIPKMLGFFLLAYYQ